MVPCVGLNETFRMVEHGSLGRILKSADFSLVLARPSTSRSPHFALHYSSASPGSTSKVTKTPRANTLSTADASDVDRPVDILCRTGAQPSRSMLGDGVATDLPADDESRRPGRTRVWIGLVVPKRHAKRSVTRTLMKRQIRVAFENARERLQPGMWVVRLKAPFGKADYPSASSTVLKQVVREELGLLVAQGVRQRERAS